MNEHRFAWFCRYRCKIGRGCKARRRATKWSDLLPTCRYRQEFNGGDDNAKNNHRAGNIDIHRIALRGSDRRI